MRKKSWKTLGLFTASFLIAHFAWQGGAESAELLLFDAKDCVITKKFDREVADDYVKSKGARVFPLRRIDISETDIGVRLERNVTLTPTFVFVDHGREIGRFEGYPGREHFYRLVDGVAELYVETQAPRKSAAPRGAP